MNTVTFDEVDPKNTCAICFRFFNFTKRLRGDHGELIFQCCDKYFSGNNFVWEFGEQNNSPVCPQCFDWGEKIFQLDEEITEMQKNIQTCINSFVADILLSRSKNDISLEKIKKQKIQKHIRINKISNNVIFENDTSGQDVGSSPTPPSPIVSENEFSDFEDQNTLQIDQRPNDKNGVARNHDQTELIPLEEETSYPRPFSAEKHRCEKMVVKTEFSIDTEDSKRTPIKTQTSNNVDQQDSTHCSKKLPPLPSLRVVLHRLETEANKRVNPTITTRKKGKFSLRTRSGRITSRRAAAHSPIQLKENGRFETEKNEKKETESTYKTDGSETEEETRVVQLSQDISESPNNPMEKILRYLCKECERTFSSKNHLKQHQMYHDKNAEEKRTCKICGKMFKKMKQLRQHSQVHMKDTYKCDTCAMGFNTKVKLNCHKIKVHTTASTFDCRDCGAQFKLKSHYQQHVRHHQLEKEEPHVCEYCGKAFGLATGLAIHMRIHMGKFQCPQCTRRFDLKSALDEHIKFVHNKEEFFKCEICEKCFVTRAGLKYHVSTHTGEKHFECKVCGEKFKTYYQIQTHRTLHTGATFDCSVCQKPFRNKAKLRIHSLIHGEKLFSCETCGKCFDRADNLRTHNRMHTGEKPYQCEVCGKGFARKDNLNSHRRRWHENTKQKKTDATELSEWSETG